MHTLRELSATSGVPVPTLRFRMRALGIKPKRYGTTDVLTDTQARQILVKPKRGAPRKRPLPPVA